MFVSLKQFLQINLGRLFVALVFCFSSIAFADGEGYWYHLIAHGDDPQTVCDTLLHNSPMYSGQIDVVPFQSVTCYGYHGIPSGFLIRFPMVVFKWCPQPYKRIGELGGHSCYTP